MLWQPWLCLYSHNKSRIAIDNITTRLQEDTSLTIYCKYPAITNTEFDGFYFTYVIWSVHTEKGLEQGNLLSIAITSHYSTKENHSQTKKKKNIETRLELWMTGSDRLKIMRMR